MKEWRRGYGRALLERVGPRAPTGRPSKQRWLTLDSGATYHLHNQFHDLVNVRRCDLRLAGIGDHVVHCPFVGDLPVACRDVNGVRYAVTIRKVYYANQGDSLLSVQQLWSRQAVNVLFADSCYMELRGGQRMPFVYREGLYQLDAEAIGSPRDPRVLKATIHRGPTSYVGRLGADEAAALMHRRFHLSAARMRTLPELSCDAPRNLARAPELSCPHCVEANGTRLPHSGSRYERSYPGRLVHGDIAGPFTPTARGHRWALILVDDHSRFKWIFFLKRKSDAPRRIETFMASLSTSVSRRAGYPKTALGHYHSDNAGEFVRPLILQFW